MAVEKVRGCGYRKVGGIYLVGSGEGVVCDRLPYELKKCPCCGAGIKQARGFTWINAKQFFKIDHDIELDNALSTKGCLCAGTPKIQMKGMARPLGKVSGCPICYPRDEQYGIQWIGDKFYTPQSFIEEARTMGISKRIAQIPKDLKLGETWILLAHPKAISRPATEEEMIPGNSKTKISAGKLFVDVPAIFYAFRPQRIEKIITDKQATKTMIKKLEKRGITPVIVPHDDPDHNPGKGKKK
jgi:hypothetical protein